MKVNELIAKIKTLLDVQDAADDAKKNELLSAFTAAMDNDLNTAQAITVHPFTILFGCCVCVYGTIISYRCVIVKGEIIIFVSFIYLPVRL